MTAYALSFLAGLVTILSPCVLPIVPMVLGSAAAGGRLGPLAFICGLVLSSAAFGFAVASAGTVLGIDPDAVKLLAAVLLLIFGVFLLSARLQNVFSAQLAGVGGLASYADRAGDWGNRGQVIAGALTGVIWTPCTGPTLGAAIGLAAQTETMWAAATMMLVFSVGAAVPLLALAYGSRHAIAARRDRLMRLAPSAKKIAGVLFVIVALLVLSGMDKHLEAALLSIMPEFILDLTTQF